MLATGLLVGAACHVSFSVMRTLMSSLLRLCVTVVCTVFRPYRVQYSRDPYSTVYAADPI